MRRGDNTYKGVGTGSTSATPALVGGSYTWASVTTGARHTCGVTTGGNAYCFGDSSNYGTLVTGSGCTVSGTPVSPIPADAGRWSSVSAGYYHTCGLKINNTIVCWCASPHLLLGLVFQQGLNDIHARCRGVNTVGQLGDNTTTNRAAPTPIIGAGPWSRVAAGTTYACAAKSGSAALWCWGANPSLPYSWGRAVPAPVWGSGASPVLAHRLALGKFHLCAAAPPPSPPRCARQPSR